MEDEHKKIALIQIFEGFCKLHSSNSCKDCIFKGCKACKKAVIGVKDNKELKDIEKILISKNVLTNN